MKSLVSTGGILIVVLCLLCVQAVSAGEEFIVQGDNPGGGVADTGTGGITTPFLSNMTLFFVPNEGQADPGVRFTCKGQGFTITYAKDRVGYSLPYDDGSAEGRYWVIQRFSGGNPEPMVEGMDPKETRVSYFSGDESEWHTNINPYGAIIYRDIYPGIDLVYRGISGSVKREFLVRPGADPSMIRMTYEGAGQVRMTGDGGLVVSAGSGEIREIPPVCYQEVGAARVEIPCRFDVRDDWSVSFYVGTYDRSLPLVIDPALVYSGYVGGSGYDYGLGIAVDTAGNAYITGSTTSTDPTFPETGGLDHNYNGGVSDAFVAKLNAGGAGLAYCGYIGGSNWDQGRAIAVDTAGNAYITGLTNSTTFTFPDTVGPDPTFNGGDYDAFVAKVNAAGTDLVYCGYIGGAYRDWGDAIAVDTMGSAYVTGLTESPESTFPETVGPDLSKNGFYDAFVAKVNADGTGLTYCGYLGGEYDDDGYGIAVDGTGCAYVTGFTLSEEDTFPVTVGPDLTYSDLEDAFVAKVNAAGTDLVYCGYIGGTDTEYGYAIAVDDERNAYVTGRTASSESESFPVTAGPDMTYNGGFYGDDAFVAKVNAAGTNLVYCGYLGGSDDDIGWGIAVGEGGNAYVTGVTYSTEATFPVKGGPDLSHNGIGDAFVAKVNIAGTALSYCGYIGGSGGDSGDSIAADNSGNAYIAGFTNSTSSSFPVKKGPDLSHNGDQDAFVAMVGADYGIGVFRPSTNKNWILDRSIDGNVDIRDHYGLNADTPLIYDFKGDWIADRVVFRAGDWILDNNMDGTVNARTHYGQAGDIPLIGDFNSDGVTDQAVFRSTEWNNWIFDLDRDGTVDRRDHFGTAGDIPLTGDFNNDGIPDRALFRATAWENWIIDWGMDRSVNVRDRYGQEGDIPLTGDFNRDGITDRAVFRAGEWIIDHNMDGLVNSRPGFGQAGDIPLVWSG